MAVLKNGVPQPNDWVRVADGEPLPETEKAIVTLERWQAERKSSKAAGSSAGVVSGASSEPEAR